MRAALLALLVLLPSVASAWGKDGHRIIATIASQRLTPAARAQVKALLAGNPDGKSLPSISMWADWVRFHELPETYNWHFVNIPLAQSTYDPRRDCRDVPGKGACIVAATERMRAVLADGRRRRGDRVEALKFVVHLVGDLHQPLHAAERDSDQGANEVRVAWFGAWERRPRQAWTLHAVWDEGMLEQHHESVSQAAVRLDAWLVRQDEDSFRRGSVTDWVLEAHAVARQQAYRDESGASLPRSGARLGRAYYDARVAAVDQQLAKAGVRLAQVLNSALQ
jgi:hypothetical protein